ncbi:MAG: hypothetical protein AB7F59_06895 [Bdellovibrionales bacterium]
MEESNKPITELPAVAQNVFISCKKCAAERYHKVLAHTTETSAKVQCEVCGSKKTFKLAKPKKATKPRKSSKRKDGKAGQMATPTWAVLKEQQASTAAQTYKMGDLYKLNTPIEHPKFGLGFVVLATPQRIDVVFEDGQRSLVHNRGN